MNEIEIELVNSIKMNEIDEFNQMLKWKLIYYCI